MEDVKNEIDRMLFSWLRQGEVQTHRAKRGLAYGFKPGQLTISRKGQQPSGIETLVVYNALRRSLKAAYLLPEPPAVQTSDLLTWPEHDAYGYRLTWEATNGSH